VSFDFNVSYSSCLLRLLLNKKKGKDRSSAEEAKRGAACGVSKTASAVRTAGALARSIALCVANAPATTAARAARSGVPVSTP